jgi:hypothetical protein
MHTKAVELVTNMVIKEKCAHIHTYPCVSIYGDTPVEVLRCARGDSRAPSVLGRYNSHCVIVTWLKFKA